MQRFNVFFLFLFSFALGALIWGIGFIFLEKTPTFFMKIDNNYNFFKIDLVPLFFKKQIVKTRLNTLKNLNFIKLKAVYKNKNKGFIIIEDKRKVIFLNLYKIYKGYKLIYIGNTFAIFSKNGKNYKVSFKNIKKDINDEIMKNTSPIIVKKKIFEEYKNNLNKIWNNIGIIRVKEGYEITYIKKGSIFSKIGLKKGDVLLEVNGIKLKNDADAWKIYKNADKIDYFEIKIKRKNQIKVLSYELY